MALKSVTQFLTDLRTVGGPSSTNQYDLAFGIDKAGINGKLAKWLDEKYEVKNNSFNKLVVDMANEIQVPGTSMVSQDVKMVHKGINMKPAMAKVFNEMDISFILDVRSEAYRFFRGWQEFITGNPTFPTEDRPVRAYVQNFYNEYVCDTTITKYEKYSGSQNTSGKDKNFKTWKVKLVKSYPYMLSSIPYSSGGSGVVKLSVGLYYEYSQFMPINTIQTSSVKG